MTNQTIFSILSTFKKFIDDDKAPYMYVTGPAGTGKTVGLSSTIKYCMKNKMNYCICAYTHKAVGVLKNKMPKNAVFSTLHSYLVKIPTINVNATKLEFVDGNTKLGESKTISILFIDEFSMIGKDDYRDIQNLQRDQDHNLITKVVFLGDSNQLPPIHDSESSVIPSGNYWVKLTHVYRQANDNKLLDTLTELTTFINGAEPKQLKEHQTFKRGVNLASEYKKHTNAVVLAYTNKRVQELNRLIEGKHKFEINDEVFSPTTKRLGYVSHILDNSKVDCITKINGDLLTLKSKYKTLETLLKLNVAFVKIYEQFEYKTVLKTRAVVFGHKDYLIASNELKLKAVEANQKIENQFSAEVGKWCKKNSDHTLSKARAKAWREFLSFNQCVICIDFKHAMTVHKSQGSTYDTVLIDTNDLSLCADKNYKLYLQLMYVAISRASKQVFTT